MNLLTDGLLIAATLFAGAYCWVLSGRVRELKDLDSGLGGAIVKLTRQIELARETLDESRSQAESQRNELSSLVDQADSAAHQMRMLLAASRDVPRPDPAPAAPNSAPPPVAESPAPAPAPAPELEAASVDTTIDEESLADGTTEPEGLGPQTDEDASHGASVVAFADIPKPRNLPPMSAPLRLFTNTNAQPKPEAEEKNILDALESLAKGEQ